MIIVLEWIGAALVGVVVEKVFENWWRKRNG